jgi:hypothetical protein
VPHWWGTNSWCQQLHNTRHSNSSCHKSMICPLTLSSNTHQPSSTMLPSAGPRHQLPYCKARSADASLENRYKRTCTAVTAIASKTAENHTDVICRKGSSRRQLAATCCAAEATCEHLFQPPAPQTYAAAHCAGVHTDMQRYVAVKATRCIHNRHAHQGTTPSILGSAVDQLSS